MSYYDGNVPTDFDAEAVLAEVLNDFWRVALHNCKIIASHQPDLLIGLAHGGSTPTRATAHLWQKITGKPAPPVLYTNLGSEKFGRYRDDCRAQGLPAPCQGLVDDDDQFRYRTWIAAQTDWLDEVRAQILNVTGQRVPDTILVIDETIAEGRALLLSLTLLELLFPLAQASFLDGPYFKWRDACAWCWLKMTQPAAYVTLVARKEQDSRAFWDIHFTLSALASGTEDVTDDSFAFRYIDEESACLQPLTPILPAATWLSMQVWIEAQIEAYFQQQIGAADAATLFQQVQWEGIRNLTVLRVTETLGRSSGLTAGEVAAMFHMSREQAAELLDALVASTDWHARTEAVPRIVRTPTRRGLIYHYEGE